jgi:NAD(P)-dependent dehydrogenase (short-subunit alcohol dehydrogenase family)
LTQTAPSAEPLPAGRLAGRIALVTGASRGLGRAIARCLAAEGAQTVLVARTVGGLEELDDEICRAGGLKPTLVPLDLRKGDKIDALGAALYERYGRLDALVGNAGMLGQLSPVGHIPPKIWDATFAVNVTANYRLLRSLDPLLRQSEAGRALFVTCAQAQVAKPYWAVYDASKAALEALVKSYALEVVKFGVKANLLAPGPFQSALRRRAFPGEDESKPPTPESLAAAAVALVSADCERTGEVIEI